MAQEPTAQSPQPQAQSKAQAAKQAAAETAMSRSSARQRLAAQRQAEQARQRRNRMIGVGALTVGVLVVIIGIFAAIALNRGSGSPATDPSATSGDYVNVLQNVPVAALDAVGAGGRQSIAQPVAGGKPELVDGKPRFLYVGAEFCPFCGTERWPLVIALSRFGTFSGLEASLSSPDEGEISNIPTVTFKNVTFTSDYLSFQSVETSDRFRKPLQPTPADVQTILNKYDLSPQGTNPIPFQYWGIAHANGASYDGTSFMPGASGDAIAAKFSDVQSPQAQAILGSANIKTAQLCQLTGGQPAAVCDSTGVRAAKAVIG